MLKFPAPFSCRYLLEAASPRIPRIAALAACLLLLVSLPQNAAAQSRTPLSSGTALYARALRLSHNAQAAKNGGIVVSVAAFPSGANAEADIYGSTDGVKFTQIGAIKDADFAGGLCCGTLYELPSAVGNLAAGTLLWSGSVGQNSTTQSMQVKIYESADQGNTWSYLSNCATGTKPGTTGGGLWEPQFTVATDGALVCFYSDETQSGHSQIIHQIRSYDGINWQDPAFTIASTVQGDRPGMPVVTKLPSGIYFMSNELCGPAACTVFYRTSADGWNWGDATNMGTRVATAAGQWFEHAPTNAWAPTAASANGTILLIGQVMFDSSGSVSSGNGITIFTNHSADGSGPWSTMPAPVQVPTAYDNYCPNYSSPLLPSVDGQSVLEFASDYSGSTCLMYYATSPILAGTLTPASVTVTPASASITTAQTVNVTVAVAPATSGPAPIGTVTLTSGDYTSGAIALSNGSATIAIPANALAVGADTLTASYSGDANYLIATGKATINVTQAVTPGFKVSAANLSISAGASSGNTVTVSITPTDGFTGSVSLSAQITSGPSGSMLYYPIVSFGATSPVNITGTSAGTATLTVLTITASSAATQAARRPANSANPASSANPWGALSLSFLFAVPFCLRRRSGLRSGLNSRLPILVLTLAFSACASALFTGCGGSGATTVAAPAGTPKGNYLIAITGTSPNASATGTFTLTVQ